MKKIITLTMTLGLLLGGCGNQPSQQVNQVGTADEQKALVQFDNVQRSGNQIAIAVSVDNTKDLSGMNGQIQFDGTKLQVLGVDKGEAVKDFLLSNNTENDTISFALAGGKGIQANKTDMIVLRFLVLQEGESRLSFVKLELMDSQLRSIPAEGRNYILVGQ